MMTESKVRRWTAPGCRRRSGASLCDEHRDPELAAEAKEAQFDSAAYFARVRAEQARQARQRVADATWAGMLAEAWRRVKVHREQRAHQRELLEGLRAAAGRVDRAGEQPRFAHG